MNVYLDLFLTFARIGACTFGGGYAMLAILQREVVESKQWATDEDLNNYFAVGQCTPGIIAVNTATFVGCSLKGWKGGLLATLGVVFPSIVIITIIAAFLHNFQDNAYVAHAFAGVRACVCILILNAVLKLRKSSMIDWPTAILFLAVFACSAVWGLSPALLVIVCGAAGLAIRQAVPAKKAADNAAEGNDSDGSDSERNDPNGSDSDATDGNDPERNTTPDSTKEP